MKKINYLFLVIVLLGALLRIIGLDINPPSLNWDEVSHGYNAYSILKTGSDEWGQLFPIFNFRAYGDYPTTLYMYLSMPFIVFDLNEWTIRLPSAILGSLLVVIVYFLSLQFTNKKSVSLCVAFLFSISPWAILISRQVLQTTPAIFLISLGVWFLIKGLDNKRWLILGLILFGFSAYAYHNTRIISPILLIVFFLNFYKKLFKFKKYILLIVAICTLFFAPLIPVVLSPEGSARSLWVSILDDGAIASIENDRNNSKLPSILNYALNNRVLYFFTTAIQNYTGYFSPNFLAIHGGTHYQFSVPGFGLIYPSELAFFYIGIVYLCLNLKNKLYRFLLIWLLISPLPASITRDPYQVVRTATLLVPLYLTSGLGILYFLNKIKHYRLKLAFFSLTLLSIAIYAGIYFYNFWTDYKTNYSFAWQYGYKQVTEYIQQNESRYDQIYITKKYGEPHEFLLFYLKYDPLLYKNDPKLIRYQKSNWFWVDRFNKYNFVNDWEIKERTEKATNSLIITSPNNYPSNARYLQTIYFLDNTPAFVILELP